MSAHEPHGAMVSVQKRDVLSNETCSKIMSTACSDDAAFSIAPGAALMKDIIEELRGCFTALFMEQPIAPTATRATHARASHVEVFPFY